MGSGRVESRSLEASGGSPVLFFQAWIRLLIFHAHFGESFDALHGKLKQRRSDRCPCRSDKLQSFQELMQPASISQGIVRYLSQFRWSLTIAVAPATKRLEKLVRTRSRCQDKGYFGRLCKKLIQDTGAEPV